MFDNPIKRVRVVLHSYPSPSLTPGPFLPPWPGRGERRLVGERLRRLLEPRFGVQQRCGTIAVVRVSPPPFHPLCLSSDLSVFAVRIILHHLFGLETSRFFLLFCFEVLDLLSLSDFLLEVSSGSNSKSLFSFSFITEKIFCAIFAISNPPVFFFPIDP